MCLVGRKEVFVNVLGWTKGIYLDYNKGARPNSDQNWSRMSIEIFSHQALCQPMEHPTPFKRPESTVQACRPMHLSIQPQVPAGEVPLRPSARTHPCEV